MSLKNQAVEDFINGLAAIPVPEKQTAGELFRYMFRVEKLASSFYDAGYNAGKTERELNDLEGTP